MIPPEVNSAFEKEEGTNETEKKTKKILKEN